MSLSDKIKYVADSEVNDYQSYKEELELLLVEDLREAVQKLKESTYNQKKKFWDGYDKIVREFVKHCKSKSKKADFMDLLDEIVIDHDVIEIEELDKIFGEII